MFIECKRDGEKCREERLETVESAVAASGTQRHLIHIEAVVRQKRLLLEVELPLQVSTTFFSTSWFPTSFISFTPSLVSWPKTGSQGSFGFVSSCLYKS